MKQYLSLIQLMLATFVFICALIWARIIYTESMAHIFLIWNILLAWIPYVVSNFFRVYEKRIWWKQMFLFGSWLLFFPNALYIITDLIHLQDDSLAPVWFDAILIFTASILGLLLAFLSLNNAEKYLAKIFSKKKMSFVIPLILIISSYGVYLGRFQRWNSWDIISNPKALGYDIISTVLSPREHYLSWAITVLLSVLFYLIYAFSKVLPEALNRNRPTP